jgi:hypothetical protein
MGKTKPNEKCPCGSNIKYKKCCSRSEEEAREAQRREEKEQFAALLKQIEESHIIDARLLKLQTHFNSKYGLQSIDLSDTVNAGNLTKIHVHYKPQRIILMMARNEHNEGAFTKKGAKDEDIMIIFRNNYQLFNYDKEYEEAIKAIDKWF